MSCGCVNHNGREVCTVLPFPASAFVGFDFFVGHIFTNHDEPFCPPLSRLRAEHPFVFQCRQIWLMSTSTSETSRLQPEQHARREL